MSACGDDEDKSTGSASGGTTVKLSSAEGQAAGSVSLAPKEGGVEIRAEVTGLRPGFHGFHIHETGTCDRSAAEGPFETAGGHFAVGEQDHGDHAGDMPPLLADEEGTATATFITTRFDIEELKGGDGSAVMVHASRDNQGNVPNRYRAGGKPGPDAETLDTGDAGDRLACGVLR
jgi:Cu-Zn family superoxide dismutase